MPENIAQSNPNIESLQNSVPEVPQSQQPVEGAIYPSKKTATNKKALKIVLIILGTAVVLFGVWFFVLRKNFSIMSPFASDGIDVSGAGFARWDFYGSGG